MAISHVKIFFADLLCNDFTWKQLITIMIIMILIIIIVNFIFIPKSAKLRRNKIFIKSIILLVSRKISSNLPIVLQN